MRRVAISSGHGLHIRGARGNPVPPQLDEVDQARRVVDRVAQLLGCPKFHDDTSTSQSANLNRITSWHNTQTRDLDVSVHFNAYDHSAHGTEVLYISQQSLAVEISAAICAAGGFTNRGAKKRTDLAFLNNTSEPAVLIETCFCDHTGDSQAFLARFEPICHAIAESISGASIAPPAEAGPPAAWPDDPYEVPVEERPVIRRGDSGQHVEDLQDMLPYFKGEADGDFGPMTEDAVLNYQSSRGLDIDGVVGQQTWTALYEHRPALPPPPDAFTTAEVNAICSIANSSWIAGYSWRDRGEAPKGYMQGMALSFASSYRRLRNRHPALVEMAKARTDSDKDALNVYAAEFQDRGMSNEVSGTDTLRHLYSLMLGHGMRESAGRHCEGRDQSADNVQSETAEAGLFQTSWNAHSASDPEFSQLMNEFQASGACWRDKFDDGVSCTDAEWSSYGSGDGRTFQDLCKKCPPFAVETAGLTLRNLCNHYGPIIRQETELKAEADDMFLDVQVYVDGLDAVA